MTKRVIDLTPDELDRLAQEAWKAAAEASLKAGADVVGNIGRKVYKVRRDGRPQIIDPAVEAKAPDAKAPPKKVVATRNIA